MHALKSVSWLGIARMNGTWSAFVVRSQFISPCTTSDWGMFVMYMYSGGNLACWKCVVYQRVFTVFYFGLCFYYTHSRKLRSRERPRGDSS